jgi:hypothetical protein
MKRHLVLANMKEMLFAIFCCFLLALVATPAGAQVSDQGICNGALVTNEEGPPTLGYATGCGAVITVTAVDANGNATAYTVTIPNNSGNSPGNGNPYDGDDDTLIGILNNSGAYLTSITLNSPDTTFGGIFNFDGDGPCNYLSSGFDCYNDGVPADTSYEADPLDYEGPSNTFTQGTPISCNTTESGLCYTNGTVSFVTTATPYGIPPVQDCDQPCNSTWFALEQTPSSLQFQGPLVPTPPNGTSTVISAPTAPITTSITLPTGTSDGDVAFIQDVQTPYPPATYNSLFFPPACTSATTSNGVCNGTANTFSGGSIVPASVQCFAMNGACIDEVIECFASDGVTRVRCDTNGIVPPVGTDIALTMQFITPTAFHNPAMLIASDCFSLGNCPASPRDWANITNGPFQPGDTCTKPPCKGGGKTGSLNSELVMADLNLSCQVLNYSLSPTSGGPGTKVTITGSLNGCKSVVPGETTLFGKFLTAQLIFTFNGPVGSSCTSESVASPALPLIVPLNASLPFHFQFKVPPNACAGTAEVTSSILSGTVSYVNSAVFTVP